MCKSSRRFKPQQQGCGRPHVRALLLCLLGVLVLTLGVGFHHLYNDATGTGIGKPLLVADLTQDRVMHKPSKSSPAQIRQLASQVDGTRLWETHLKPILIERLPGTRGSLIVRQHIASTLSSLSAAWDIRLDSFQSSTPRGRVAFTNIVATLDPSAPRRLLLTCHYDSKALPPDGHAPERVFLGACDSAVPCAMILELATSLDNQLRSFKQQKLPLSLQLVFFDGEESFEEWTATDSLYGSRHMAERMARTPHPAGSTHTTMLEAVDLFVLLDLLGGPDPLIVNHFDNTARWFDRLIAAEKRLHRQGLLVSHPSEQSYFRKDLFFGPVQDDHIPFLHRGDCTYMILRSIVLLTLHTIASDLHTTTQPRAESGILAKIYPWRRNLDGLKAVMFVGVHGCIKRITEKEETNSLWLKIRGVTVRFVSQFMLAGSVQGQYWFVLNDTARNDSVPLNRFFDFLAKNSTSLTGK